MKKGLPAMLKGGVGCLVMQGSESHTWGILGHTFLEQLVKSTILTDVAPLCEVIMDVMNKEQAKIAEEAGACAVMALERTLACNSFKISLQSCFPCFHAE